MKAHCLFSPEGRGRWGRGALGPQLGSPCIHPLQPALLLSFQNNNSSLLNNYVLGAQLGQRHVKNLREPVNISFWHNRSLVLLGVPPFPPHPCPFVALLLNSGSTKPKPRGSVLKTNCF